jgi:hypothetical protein
MKLMFRDVLKLLKNYTNSNWTEDQDIKRSISKYAFNVNSEIINWFYKASINRDVVYLRDWIHRTNVNRKRNYLIMKSDDSIDIWRRIFSNDNNIRRQSRRHYFDQEFSISCTNKAHRYSNSFHQRENDRRFHRLNLRFYQSNDNWWSDQIINQRQIYSISRRFRNRIITLSAKDFATAICVLRDSNLGKSINVFRD